MSINKNSKENKLLKPEHIVGMAEFHGHFHLSVVQVKAQSPTQKRYSRSRQEYTDELYKGLTFFYIVARIDDIKVLEKIQTYFGCGHIERFQPVNNIYEKFKPDSPSWNKSPFRLRQSDYTIFDENPLDPNRAHREIINYHVTDPYDLRTTVIPFFETYPFQGTRMQNMLKGFKKGVDYCLEYSEFLKVPGLLLEGDQVNMKAGAFLEGESLVSFRRLCDRLPSQEDGCFYIAPRAAKRRHHLENASKMFHNLYEEEESKLEEILEDKSQDKVKDLTEGQK